MVRWISFLPRAGRSAGIVVIAVCAFLLTCLLGDRLLPKRELPWLVREKMAHLAAHGNDYNALFIGSSRMQDNIIPAVFDRDVDGQGFTIRSFNAGISGMYPPQDAYLLDQILHLKLTGIRWVFIELQTLQTTLPRANRQTLQQLYWHDWPRFSLLCERFVATQSRRHWRDRVAEVGERWPDFCDHVLLFVRRFTSLGRGSVLLNRWVFREPITAEDWSLLGDYGDGWTPAGTHRGLDPQETAALESDLEVRRKKPPVREAGDRVTQKALDLMIAKIQRAGATPILIVPPTARGTYFAPDPAQARNLVILNFCDPPKYPELYLTKYRVDPSHLNAAGAEIFSHLLAQRFIEAVGRK